MTELRKQDSPPPAARSKRRRGRPPKSNQKQILKTGRKPMAEEFRVRPLRRPVDVQFEPYYKRILEGDLSAVLEYIDRNEARGHLDPSFYELLGRLATLRYYAVANLILSNIESRGCIGKVTDKEADAYWYERLLPLAARAKNWIREYIRSLSDKWNREEAWPRYAEETCKDDWERAAESHAKGWPPPPQTCDLERHRIIYYAGEEPLWRQHYMGLGLVPKELFWLLAELRGTAKRPSWALRQYLRECDSLIKAKKRAQNN